jgi:phosphoribosyl-AMP cyclohydrolase
VTPSDEALDPEIAARLKRSADGLVPAIVQQHDTGEVLMLGWMDDEALHRTLTSGRATYWSRSRQEYWVKGETSGNVQWVKAVRLDCDGDALLVQVDQEGVACHTGDRTCFDADVLLAGPATDARRFTRAPVVLAGVLAGIALAVAGSHRWIALVPVRVNGECVAPCTDFTLNDELAIPPAVSALALVGLVCWGLVLVTGGRLRRTVAWLGALSALGAVVAAVAAFFMLADDARELFKFVVVPVPDVDRTGWAWVGVASATLALLAWLAAIRFVGDWPGLRRPRARGASKHPVEPQTHAG